MNTLPPNHQDFIERFTLQCQADGRVVAAFTGGSHARSAADAFSDLDLYLVTKDEDFEAFLVEKYTFLRELGEALFLEDFDIPDMLFFILADGLEGELGIGRRGQFEQVHSGPFLPLLDKAGLLEKVAFQPVLPDYAERREFLRRQVSWFWHDLSHFITALGRGQLWWACSQIELLRANCMNLMRLRENFQDPEVGEEAAFKIEKSLRPDLLEVFSPTYCPLQVPDMLRSVSILIRLYQELVPSLAREHGLEYPSALESLMLRRWEKLLADIKG